MCRRCISSILYCTSVAGRRNDWRRSVFCRLPAPLESAEGRFAAQDLQRKTDLRQKLAPFNNKPVPGVGLSSSLCGPGFIQNWGFSRQCARCTYLVCTAKLYSMAVSVYIPSENRPIGSFLTGYVQEIGFSARSNCTYEVCAWRGLTVHTRYVLPLLSSGK